MTRLTSIAKAGHYPTPPHLLLAIAAQLAPADRTGLQLLDAFCGTGAAAAALCRAWNLNGTGVEVNRARANAARERLQRVVCGDALQLQGTHGQFAVCFHNPPYQDALQRGDHRLEHQATLAVTPYLAAGGWLVAVLPDYLMWTQTFAEMLTARYRVSRCFRFPEPDYARFKQVVLYASRRARPNRSPDAAQALIDRLRSAPPTLPLVCTDPLRIPLVRVPRRAYFRGRSLDPDAMVHDARRSDWPGARRFTSLIAPPEDLRARRPAMPLKVRHLAQFIVAALLNNVALEHGGVTHVICGRTRKQRVETGRDKADGGGRETVVSETFSEQLLAFDPASGEFLDFDASNAAGLRAYIRTWRAPLIAAVQARFPAVYNFDFRTTFPDWLTTYIDHEAAHTAGDGLWEGQKHALAATLVNLLLDEARPFFIPAAAMGFGKTMLAAAVMGALARLYKHENPGHAGWPPSIFVTEPTLLDQTVAEIKKCDPLLRPYVVRTVAEARQFLADVHSAPWPMVLVTARTSAKDGHGWRAAVVPRRIGRRVLRGSAAGRLVLETRFACPHCGALQRERDSGAHPDLWLHVDDGAYFEQTRRTCSNGSCGAPLWQDYRSVGGQQYTPEYWECAQHWRALQHRVAGDASRMAIDDIVCEVQALGPLAEFKLARGDQVYECDGRLAVRRAGRVVAVYDRSADRLRLGAVCEQFGPPLPGQTVWRVPRPHAELVNPPPVRMALAEYLLRVARKQGRFLVCAIDELQKYKGSSTNAGYALDRLMRVAEKVVALTGTLYGGYASNLFALLYRTDPQFRRQWPHDGVHAFVRRYGLLEWVEDREPHAAGDRAYTRLGGYRIRREGLRELPATSPELTALLLDRTLFLGLQDLGVQLVPRHEHAELVAPEADLRAAYDAFLADAKEAFRRAREQQVNITGAFLHAMLSYTAAPWRRTEIRDRRTGTVWAWAPDLEVVCRHCGRTLLRARECRACHAAGDPPRDCRRHGCGEKRRRIFAKEQRLLDNLQAAKQAGRPALVFALHTGTLDLVTPRWTGPAGLCAAAGLKAVNGNHWPARGRMAQLERAVLGGVDVIFINPAQVETGMNLVWLPELHWLQLSYSLYLVEQASARAHRPTQTQDVHIHFYATADTYEQRALARVMEKRIARLTLRGDPVDSNLARAAGVSDDSMLQQIITDVAAAAPTDLNTLFAEYNRLADGALRRPSEFITAAGVRGSAAQNDRPDRSRPECDESDVYMHQSAEQLSLFV